eukprot:gene4700-37714_t
MEALTSLTPQSGPQAPSLPPAAAGRQPLRRLPQRSPP